MSGLTNGTTYYVRAYVTNSSGTNYGNTITFTTLPNVTTNAISSITGSTALCGGSVSSKGGATVLARGVCWSTNQAPTVNDYKTIDGSGAGTFTSLLTGLLSETKYYARSYATNVSGTNYGTEVSFTTMNKNNLLVNPSFEDWSNGTAPDGWILGTQMGVTLNPSTSIFNDNTKSLQVVSSSTGSTFNVSQIVPITPGKTYTIKMNYFIESGDGTDARIWSDWVNVVSGAITAYATLSHSDSILVFGPGGNNSYFPDVKGVWNTYSCEITAPATGYNSFNFQFRTYRGAIVYWDNLYFGEKSAGLNAIIEKKSNISLFTKTKSITNVDNSNTDVKSPLGLKVESNK